MGLKSYSVFVKVMRIFQGFTYKRDLMTDPLSTNLSEFFWQVGEIFGDKMETT